MEKAGHASGDSIDRSISDGEELVSAAGRGADVLPLRTVCKRASTGEEPVTLKIVV